MSSNDPENRRPERPRSEPEIIPPSRDGGAQNDLSAMWIRIDERDGVRRVYLTRPGPFSIVLGLMVLGLIAAVIFLLLAGVLLIWIPLVVAGVLLALLAGTVRYHWWRLKAWWGR